MDAQKLYDCFKSHNQRRLLSILCRCRATITDLSKITGFSTPYISQLVRAFVKTGIIFRYKEKEYKTVVYMSPHLYQPFHDSDSVDVDYNYNALTLFEKKRVKEELPGYKGGDHDGKVVGRMFKKPKGKNFIREVFQLFGFEENTPFKECKDYKYIQNHRNELKGHAFLTRNNPAWTNGRIEEFNRRKEAREKNLKYFT